MTWLRRIQQHQKKFATLLKNVDKFLEGISVVFPSISFELPSFCEYWKWKSVKRFTQKYRLVDYKLHGCQVGVTDEHGTPFKRVGQFHPMLRRLLLSNSLGVMDSTSMHNLGAKHLGKLKVTRLG